MSSSLEMSSHSELIQNAFTAHLALAKTLAESHSTQIAEIAERIIGCLQNGGKTLWCGNGGSAADAQHLAAELIGRFKAERGPLPAIALTTDTSILTCIGNDYGFDQIFSRQVGGLMSNKDILVVFSTSGNSPNVLRAVAEAKRIGGYVVGFLGNEGGKLKAECDLPFVVPSNDTARIQEMHIFAGHVICALIDKHYA